jgi:DNA polymerase-3 subunit gamma/tau
LPIARRAEGGLRDALSLLDQVVSYAGEHVTEADVRTVLGLVTDDLYLELFSIVADRRYGDVFRFVQRLLDEGYDLTEFYRGLADSLRVLLAIKFDGYAGEEIREDLRAAYQERAERFGTGDLLRMLAIVAELDVEGRFRKSTNPRTMLEALLLRFAYLDRTVDIEELLGAAPAASPAAQGSPGASPAGSARPGAPPVRARSGASPPAERQPPPAAPPEPRRSATPRDAEDPARDEAGHALRRIVQLRKGPAGTALFLATANARLVDDRVVLELSPGPALERLGSDDVARRSLENAFAEEIGRPVRLVVRAPGDNSPTERLTPERIRTDQLARLTRADPALGRAVDAWDLELFD